MTTKPGDELFDAFPNSYGSLGYATRIRIRLEKAPRFVGLRHLRFDDLGPRYIGKRYPVDYGTFPLLLFWGMILVWLLPWSPFLPQAIRRVRLRLLHTAERRSSPAERAPCSRSHRASSPPSSAW